jgi:hypothetical protein
MYVIFVPTVVGYAFAKTDVGGRLELPAARCGLDLECVADNA